MPFPIWNTFLYVSQLLHILQNSASLPPSLYLDIPIHPQNSGSPLDSRNLKSFIHHSPDLTHPSCLGTPLKSRTKAP